ncbi:hypothetical protein RM697_09255 [Ichthyenterobacterium sp. W332]|uniref:Lipoprotein n=1 Tax=Microcosmobacter mediterraneus TaxID=3075607 RepID=A0ABU2YNJ4_9FLAO|nr:hypothetical protein [Ichthyenterobacterium sp. W332]MDT0558835.1 hypothetical protein [Ichthyenterobacterium sp. W332]
MKFFKPLLLLFTVLLFTCSSDDDGGDNAPVVITPTISVDVNVVLALPDGSDITNLVNFGQPIGVSSADWEVELEIGDILTLGQPTGFASGDVLFYDVIVFFDDVGEEVDEVTLAEYLDFINCVKDDGTPDPECDDTLSALEYYTTFSMTSVDAEDDFDINYKYSMEVYIAREGETDRGPFIIDPKIKIKSRN